MKSTLKILSTVIALSLTNSINATQYTLSSAPQKGTVSFRAIGKPAFLKIDGKGEGPTGNIQVEGNKMSGEMTFALKTLDTGIELRDEHMKDKYLKIKESPTATLKFSNQELNTAFDTSAMQLKGPAIKATLTLNKVSKELSVDWKSENKGSELLVTSNFSIKLSDYNIEIPEYAGIKVADEVKVEVQSTLSANSTAALAR